MEMPELLVVLILFTIVFCIGLIFLIFLVLKIYNEFGKWYAHYTSDHKRFQVCADKVIKDTKTNLEWYVKDDQDIDHYNAAKWINSLGHFVGGGWKMPEISDLKATGNCFLDFIFEIDSDGWQIWSGDICDEDGNLTNNENSSFAYIYLADGVDWENRTFSESIRAVAVRRGRH